MKKAKLTGALRDLAEALANKEKNDPRNDAEASYRAFMSMPQSEWLGLLGSLASGGILRVEEQKGFERARADRAKKSSDVFPNYKGGALKNQKPTKPEPTFAVLLTNFETLVREHQMERLREYKDELKKDIDKLRLKILEAFHHARFEARK